VAAIELLKIVTPQEIADRVACPKGAERHSSALTFSNPAMCFRRPSGGRLCPGRSPVGTKPLRESQFEGVGLSNPLMWTPRRGSCCR
jgi:hypothetical protein